MPWRWRRWRKGRDVDDEPKPFVELLAGGGYRVGFSELDLAGEGATIAEACEALGHALAARHSAERDGTVETDKPKVLDDPVVSRPDPYQQALYAFSGGGGYPFSSV
jgi:hypothetical protein